MAASGAAHRSWQPGWGLQFPAFDLYSICFPACLQMKVKLQSYGKYHFLGWMDNHCAFHPRVCAVAGIAALE